MIHLNKWRIKEACELNGGSITWLAGCMRVTTKTIHVWIREGFTPDKARAVAFWTGSTLDQLSDTMTIKADNRGQSGGPGDVSETLDRR